jgi:threonine dehydratase
MRALGAEVRLVGADFDEAKAAARRYAEENGLTFVEDGREPAITEGAGTIAIELLRDPRPFDAVLIPLGNGALINGVGAWMKAHSPGTEVTGVGAECAPAMERSFRARRPIALEEPVATIADGVATRVPVPEAVETMLRVVDDVLLVEEDAIVDAMQVIFRELGLVVEGAGAVTLAAAAVHRERFRGRRVAMIVGGGNATRGEIREFVCGGDVWESE